MEPPSGSEGELSEEFPLTGQSRPSSSSNRNSVQLKQMPCDMSSSCSSSESDDERLHPITPAMSAPSTLTRPNVTASVPVSQTPTQRDVTTQNVFTERNTPAKASGPSPSQYLRFQCPNPFKGGQVSTSTHPNKLDGNNKEFWLLEAPLDVDLEKLNGKTLFLNRPTTVRVMNTDSKRTTHTSLVSLSSFTQNLQKTSILLSNNNHKQIIPAKNQVSGLLTLINTFEVPEDATPEQEDQMHVNEKEEDDVAMVASEDVTLPYRSDESTDLASTPAKTPKKKRKDKDKLLLGRTSYSESDKPTNLDAAQVVKNVNKWSETDTSCKKDSAKKKRNSSESNSLQQAEIFKEAKMDNLEYFTDPKKPKKNKKKKQHSDDEGGKQQKPTRRNEESDVEETMPVEKRKKRHKKKNRESE